MIPPTDKTGSLQLRAPPRQPAMAARLDGEDHRSHAQLRLRPSRDPARGQDLSPDSARDGEDRPPPGGDRTRRRGRGPPPDRVRALLQGVRELPHRAARDLRRRPSGQDLPARQAARIVRGLHAHGRLSDRARRGRVGRRADPVQLPQGAGREEPPDHPVHSRHGPDQGSGARSEQQHLHQARHERARASTARAKARATCARSA